MKYLLILILTFFILSFQSIDEKQGRMEYPKSSNAASKALIVLETKCNFCHKKRRRKRVFKAGNMERFAPQIYKQVFVKKRMPKGGKKNKLSNSELEILKTWLEETNVVSKQN